MERSVRRFEDYFPREGDERGSALDALVSMALDEEDEYRPDAHLLLVELGAEQLLAPTPAVLSATSGKAVAPKLYGAEPQTPPAPAPAPAATPVQGEPVLPPELQEAADAQPSLELEPAAAPQSETSAPAKVPDRFDYIPLEPHGPQDKPARGQTQETPPKDRGR